MPSDSPYAADLLAAAKRASRVTDTRILQVLDAVDDGELSYVVREWATGQSLDIVLSEGPLAARRATWLMREVAAAVSNAHRLGLPHRRLAPDNVVVTKSSGVKLIGLGTAAALRGEPGPDDDPELEDTLDLGRLLYACLTARWPGGDNPGTGFPTRPTEHGRLLRPRQVRAGVPRPLDAVCDRILGQQSRYGATDHDRRRGQRGTQRDPGRRGRQHRRQPERHLDAVVARTARAAAGAAAPRG